MYFIKLTTPEGKTIYVNPLHVLAFSHGEDAPTDTVIVHYLRYAGDGRPAVAASGTAAMGDIEGYIRGLPKGPKD